MKIQIEEGQDTKQEVLALGLFEEDQDMYKEKNPVLDTEIKIALKKEIFTTEFGKIYVTKITSSTYDKVIVISLGKKKDINAEKIRKAASKIIRYIQGINAQSFTTNIPELVNENKNIPAEEIGRAFAEGLVLSEYVFDKYLSKPKIKKINSGSISWTEDKKEFEKGVNAGKIIAENTNFTRQLVNEPAEYMTPEQIEREALKLKNKNIKVTVLGRKQLQKEGMNGILSVGKGSIHEPRLIILEYVGSKEKPTAIVGKGISFDSGGYHVKPFGFMEDMKCDMAGAAAVLGTIKNASDLGLKKNIIGVIPTCENMISGGAYRPGDIIKMHNGKTVEVMNTDAEGRLVLADAISYVEKKYKPETIIDLATLTGAVVIALGYYTAGFVTNDCELQKKLENAGNESYDRVWNLPFHEEYQDMVDGDVSDFANISKKQDRAAGTIVGGVFLSKFVDKAKWAHIDIAATAYLKEAKEYNSKFATGSGVRLLTYYFMK
ncbi:MAG: leucyl aminopeptidase [Candidatus Woesearchaeota archaeon]|jgi:leucyl aminopeptidase